MGSISAVEHIIDGPVWNSNHENERSAKEKLGRKRNLTKYGQYWH